MSIIADLVVIFYKEIISIMYMMCCCECLLGGLSLMFLLRHYDGMWHSHTLVAIKQKLRLHLVFLQLNDSLLFRRFLKYMIKAKKYV